MSGRWEFACPECSFSHIEFGVLALDDDVYCVVCLDEQGRHVRLHRWVAVIEEAPSSDHANS